MGYVGVTYVLMGLTPSWSRANIPGPSLLKGTNSPFPGGHPLLIPPELGVEARETAPQAGMLTDLVLPRPCAGTHSCREFKESSHIQKACV